jgi:UDP-N-acetylglucosamine 2-epimerase (non-hydrolysing)
MHPRTRDRIDKAQLWDRLDQRCVLVTPPLTYLEMIGLMKEARLAVTDSGGVQEETTALGVPCLTVRDNTERPITISEGTNTLVGSSPPALLAAAYKELKTSGKRGRIPELWDGRAAERIVTHVTDFIERYKAA